MEAHPKARAMMKHIMVWIEQFIEICKVWEEADDNPLNTPILQGPRAARRIPKTFKEEVVRQASRGKGLKSGGHLLELLTRLKIRRFWTGFKSSGQGNRWSDTTMARYLIAVVRAFSNVEYPLYSASWDGTRLSGKDMMFCTIYNHGVGKACWCPPQVPTMSLKLCPFCMQTTVLWHGFGDAILQQCCMYVADPICIKIREIRTFLCKLSFFLHLMCAAHFDVLWQTFGAYSAL